MASSATRTLHAGEVSLDEGSVIGFKDDQAGV